MEEASPALAGNNRYSFRSAGSRSNYGDYNYKWEHGNGHEDVDGIADSSTSSSSSNSASQDSEDNNDNDNYNYNKAPAKWQKQKLYGNPIHSIHDLQQHLRQQEQGLGQEQGQGQFDDDPENARNDFRLQLSDLNAAVPGVGRFVVAQDHDSPNNWLTSEEGQQREQEREQKREQEQILLARRSRSSQQR